MLQFNGHGPKGYCPSGWVEREVGGCLCEEGGGVGGGWGGEEEGRGRGVISHIKN